MSYSDKKNRIDSLKQKIDAFGELRSDVKNKVNYKFRLDWNYYSNSMEGNTLTKEETRSVMIGNLTVGGKPIKDVLEMKGHDEVINEILKLGKGDVRLSEARIREIHKAIMHEEDESKRSKIGKWKTDPNYLYNYKGERFDFVLPIEVPSKIHDLLNRTNAGIDSIRADKKNAPHPIDVALQFHLDYVMIHPFYDGNGRTARIFTNLILISLGYPPFWVKTNEKNIYNQYLGDIQGYGGSPDMFFEFASDLIFRSQNLVLDAIEGKDISELDDIDKELALLKTELTGNNILTKSKSEDNIDEAIEHNIIPLYHLIEQKCQGVKEFFFDHEINIEPIFKESEEDRLFNEAFKININYNSPDQLIELKLLKKDLLKLCYNFNLNGFKNRLSANSFSIYVEINFDIYNYKISTNTNLSNPLIIPYGKKLSHEDLMDIISPAIKLLIERIKELNRD